MSSSKKFLTAALAALSLSSCTETTRPTVSQPSVIPSKVTIEQPIALPLGGFDAGAPVVTTIPEAPVDPLVVAHDSPSVDHLGRSKTLLTDGDLQGALLEARRALFTTPGDVELLTTVAKLSRRAGKPGMAAEAWGRVSELTPDDASPVIQRARALMQLKDSRGALEAGREAVRRDPGNAEAFQVTGIAQLSLDELAGAIVSFEKVVELQPQHGWALNNLGFACLRANEDDKAVSALERAAERLPNVAAVHNNLGVALERVGRKDEARAAYLQAMDLSPKYVKARVNADRVAKAQLTPTEPQLDDVQSDQVHPLPEQP